MLKKVTLLKHGGAIDRWETEDNHAEWFVAGMDIDSDHAFMVRRRFLIP